MKSHSSRTRVLKALALATFAVAFGWVTPASAQHPTANTWTAEGTEIKNKASASFTDARGNAYTDVESNEVVVTVGFRGSIAVLAGAATMDVSQGTTANTASFTVTNYGNGADSVKFAFTNSNGTTFTNATLCVPDGADADTDPDCYASVADLRAANLSIAAGASLVVTVTFDVEAGSGGETGTLTLAGSSGRDATNTADSDLTDLSVALVDAPGGDDIVTVTAGGPASVVPTNYNGTTRLYYDATFTVDNGLAGGAPFDLSAGITGDADITIIRLTLCSDKATAITSTTIAFGGSASICVLYNVDNAATAADAASITLTATAQADAGVTDNDAFDVAVVKAAITLTKKAFLDDGTTEITTEEPLPGDFIIYEITVKNEGGAEATTVSITDVLPGEVTFVSATGDAAGWTIDDSAAPTITGTLATLAASDERFFRIRVQIN